MSYYCLRVTTHTCLFFFVSLWLRTRVQYGKGGYPYTHAEHTLLPTTYRTRNVPTYILSMYCIHKYVSVTAVKRIFHFF